MWAASDDQRLKDVRLIEGQITRLPRARKFSLLGKAIVSAEQACRGSVEDGQQRPWGCAIARHGIATERRQGIALCQQAGKLDSNCACARTHCLLTRPTCQAARPMMGGDGLAYALALSARDGTGRKCVRNPSRVAADYRCWTELGSATWPKVRQRNSCA